jgi:hypothetical protein
MLEPDAHTSSEDDPILAELDRIRAEQSAAYGYDMERRTTDTRRLQFLFGNDVVARSKSGDIKVIFKGTGKISADISEWPTLKARALTDRGSRDG